MEAARKKDDLPEVLEAFGFSDVEVSVYQTGLGLGSRPASIIAERSGLKRSHTYSILDSLMKKGLVQEFVKNNVRHFSFSPPKSLISFAQNRELQMKQQMEELESLVPLLEKFSSPVTSKPKVRFFHGVNGIKEIFDDMLVEPDKSIYGLVDVAYSGTFCPKGQKKWLDKFVERRVERNIWWKGIIVKSPETDERLRSQPGLINREVKMIEDVELPMEVNIYDNKIAITSTHTETVGLIIENQQMADGVRNLHQFAWNFLPNYEVA